MRIYQNINKTALIVGIDLEKKQHTTFSGFPKTFFDPEEAGYYNRFEISSERCKDYIESVDEYTLLTNKQDIYKFIGVCTCIEDLQKLIPEELI